jgi:phosphoglycerate kinase
VLENLRFDPRETSKDARPADLSSFAAQLAGLGEPAFVSDGFGVVHRKQASVYDARPAAAALRRLPAHRGARGPRQAHRPTRSGRTSVLLGGSKVSRQAGRHHRAAGRVDTLLIGGGMAFTFLAAQGHGVGRLDPAGRPARHRAGYLLASSGDRARAAHRRGGCRSFSADADHVVPQPTP